MSFTSEKFVIFLLIVLVVYGLAPKKWRWGVLLTASYIFYGLWNLEYIWVLALITLSSYWISRRMARTDDSQQKSQWLILSIALVLLVLGVFKYYDYLILAFENYSQIDLPFPLLQRIAPLGISFFSLQVIAYLVDVYRGKLPPADHLGHYAVFVSFFPQLVAGPITRAQKLLPQIKFLPPVLAEDLQKGFQRLLLGLLQKFVIADRLANFTTPIFDDFSSYSRLVLLVNLYVYAVQIYADFAGYSNIAIGIAKLFGVDLAENFRQPYLALDVAKFWNRWHISLSNWLRDYIFYPTMRFLRKKYKSTRAWWMLWVPPLVTMLVSGIWHGTGPQFILWGLLHGSMLALSAATSQWRKDVTERLGKAGWIFQVVQWLLTFNFIVFSWAIFRIPGLHSSILYLRDIAGGTKASTMVHEQAVWGTVIILVVFSLFEILLTFNVFWQKLEKAPLVVRWGAYYLLIFIIMFLGNFEGSQPFIYEQF